MDANHGVLGRTAAATWWRIGGAGLARVPGWRQQVGMLAQPVAGALDLHHDGVVEQPVQQRGGDHGVTEHVVIPLSLNGESLGSR